MNWRETLEKEHENISSLLDIMNEKTIELLNTKEIDVAFFEKILFYISTYADKEHHQKEENGVFALMKEATEQGRILVENGMLVEHQMARYYVKEMKKLIKQEDCPQLRVKLIGFAQAYIDLLRRHIDKENHVAYPYAQKVVDEEKLQAVFDTYPKAEHEAEVLQFIQQYT